MEGKSRKLTIKQRDSTDMAYSVGVVYGCVYLFGLRVRGWLTV